MAYGQLSAYVTAIPLGRRLPGASSNQPGRPDQTRSRSASRLRAKPSRRPYSVLLPVGFAVPPALPPARCALTAPFHPYRVPPTPSPKRGRVRWGRAVCSLWHFPWTSARRTLSGTVCPWSPDFPPRRPLGFAGAAARPTDERGMGSLAVAVKGRYLRWLYDAMTSRSNVMARAAMDRGRPR